MDYGTVFEKLQTSKEGLKSSDAQKRLESYGRNELPRKQSESLWKLLFRQINNPLIYVLIGSAALAVAMGKLTDGLVVAGVVIVNAIIGFVQEARSRKAIEALQEMVPDTVVVIRDGAPVSIESALLVPGDVITLQSGDMTPADLRLIEARSLRINESALTGESLPADKTADTIDDEVSLGDRRNMAFSGTTVTSGAAKGVVVQAGPATELGKIDIMLTETVETRTPLTRSISAFARLLTFIILAVAAVLVGIALLRGYPIADAVLAAIALAVAAIPEGIPAIITIALAIGVRRMARRRAVIRHLPAVETLGSTTVICSDKTGTITRNEMTVNELWTPRASIRLEGVGYGPSGPLYEGEREVESLSDDMRELLTAGVLCNDSHLREDEGRWRIEGDPTEAALLTAARKAGLTQEIIVGCNRRIDAIPFESEHKFMATLNVRDGKRAIYVKGAPEIVIGFCVLDEQTRGNAREAIDAFASRGKRVLAFARKDASAGAAKIGFDDVKTGFELLGLTAMIDPPREEAHKAIERCRTAGMTVKMITGDHQTTAAAIGGQLGIMTDRGALTGAGINDLSDDELREIAAHVNVFARVAPEHKLKLVGALRGAGEVVAMTGDGVNDAPALKRADIGVAMGITGTDASRQAADMILTDDNFATIVSAVEEGRRVYDNLIKALAFALPTNLGEALILLVAVAFFPIIDGIPLLPMLPVQILWINLVATVSLALPLAFETPEKNIMNRPPRNPDEKLLNPFVLFRTALVALLMTAVAIGLFLQTFNRQVDAGVPTAEALSQAQTMAVTSIVFLQVFYLLNCRSLQRSVFTIGLFSNKAVIVGVLTLLFLQTGYVYLPFMNALFGSAPLDVTDWLESALFGAVVLPVITVEKFIRQRR
ncbi:MAG: HAD-IC family P-type ATPase [Chitinivibrionales bacterium]|nr:HAD-IC family P-type ATPase [Chitinivibrionales bacterium]MBD3356106.1 HAD-IC family P-type ATPase [Chitinivibrionales bacterium]